MPIAGRRRGVAAVPDRSGEPRDDRRRAATRTRTREARFARGLSSHAARPTRAPPRSRWDAARSASRACAWRSGTRSSTRTGRSSRNRRSNRNWPQRLWDFTKHHQYIGRSGRRAASATSAPPRSARRSRTSDNDGVVCVNIQGDGDFMMRPGALWTRGASPDPAADGHAQQPRLAPRDDASSRRIAGRRDRHPRTRPHRDRDHRPEHRLRQDGARASASTREGPITTPDQLGPAIARALKVVKSGHPALIDVVTQPR